VCAWAAGHGGATETQRHCPVATRLAAVKPKEAVSIRSISMPAAQSVERLARFARPSRESGIDVQANLGSGSLGIRNARLSIMRCRRGSWENLCPWFPLVGAASTVAARSWPGVAPKYQTAGEYDDERT
jgi:hypothetical protein